MNNAMFPVSLAVVLVLFCVSETAGAKSPTVKITIAGGTLAHPIEVTDPQLLALSNVWSGQFLDLSRRCP